MLQTYGVTSHSEIKSEKETMHWNRIESKLHRYGLGMHVVPRYTFGPTPCAFNSSPFIGIWILVL